MGYIKPLYIESDRISAVSRMMRHAGEHPSAASFRNGGDVYIKTIVVVAARALMLIYRWMDEGSICTEDASESCCSIQHHMYTTSLYTVYIMGKNASSRELHNYCSGKHSIPVYIGIFKNTYIYVVNPSSFSAGSMLSYNSYLACFSLYTSNNKDSHKVPYIMRHIVYIYPDYIGGYRDHIIRAAHYIYIDPSANDII